MVFDPSETVAPTIKTPEGATLAEDGTDLTIEFDAATFNVSSPVGYDLYAAASGSETAKKLTASISGNVASVKQKDLNSFILDAGGIAGEEFAVDFYLMARLLNDKNAAIAGTESISNTVTAKFIPYEATLTDADKFSHIWVIGASETVGAWDHNKVKQFLYNYNGDGSTYTGLIYYGDNAAGGWKLTGIAGWEDDVNWGSEAQAEDPESVSITLISGGGSKDIKCYSKQYYMWTFDKSSLKLTKQFGFDKLGMTGTINGWDATTAVEMTYNMDYHRFYIDYEFTEDSEIKFVCDNDWAINFGVNCKQGGDNVKVTTGNYRVYVDMNNNEISLNANMYGKEEPTIAVVEPPKPAFEGWSIIGTMTGWNDDYDMVETSAGVWEYKNLSVTETDEFKIRKDHDWVESVGGPEENADSMIDPEGNPYKVFKPEIGTPFTAGGKNISIQVAGAYDIVYDTNAKTITITEHLPGWAVIGEVEGSAWGRDFEMTEGANGVWVSDILTVNGKFKLRYNANWDINRGGAFAELDKPFAAIEGGTDIAVPVADDKYIITYYSTAEAITVHNVSKGWSIIGMINGSSWDTDVFMVQTAENIWSGTCKVDSECKIRYAAAWEKDRGGAFAELDTPFDAIAGGANIKLDPGYYTITYNATNETISVSVAWGVIGLNADWNNEAYWMLKDGAGNFVCNNVLLPTEWKLRYNGGWDDNRGGEFAALDTPFSVVKDGPNIGAVEGLVNIIYKPADETITISKAML